MVKIFRVDPFSSFYVKLLTDKQTEKNRQTDKRRALHNLLDGGNKHNNVQYAEIYEALIVIIILGSRYMAILLADVGCRFSLSADKVV